MEWKQKVSLNYFLINQDFKNYTHGEHDSVSTQFSFQ